jgi:iron complex transport system substrate-binding protein
MPTELRAENLALTRVVSLQPSATTIIAALGLIDSIVACTRYCLDVCPEAGGKIVVEDSWTAQAAQIIAADPDLVIASVPYQLEAVGEILKAGIRFFGLAPRTLNDIFTDIAAIAGLLGVSERGERLIHVMCADIEDVRQTASHANEQPRVFCEEWGKPIIASQPWVAELVQAAGGEFVGTPGKQIAADEVAAASPDVVVAAWCGAGDRVPLEKIVKQRSWLQLPAVREARVYCVRDEFLNTPGPTLLQGLHALAHAIHPELFSVTDGIRRIVNPATGPVIK